MTVLRTQLVRKNGSFFVEIFSGRPFQFVHSIISACLQAASSVSGAMGIAPYDLNLHRRETPGLRTNKGIHIFFLLFLPAIYFAASSSCDLLQCVSGCLHPLDNLIKCMFSSFRKLCNKRYLLSLHTIL